MSTRPLPGYLVVDPQKESQTAGGVFLPDTASEDTGPIATGVVVAIPDNSDRLAGDTPLAAGMRIAYRTMGGARVPHSDHVLIARSAVVGLIHEENSRGMPLTLMQLPSKEEYMDKSVNSWEEYTNVRSFEFVVRFLQPFQGLKSVGRQLHEQVVSVVASNPRYGETLLQKVNYIETEEGMYTVNVTDDLWDGVLGVSERDRAVVFRKDHTDMATICTTVPAWLTAFRNVIAGDDFRAAVAHDYSRVFLVATKIKQIIRIKGMGLRGKTVRNSQLMRQFLQLEPPAMGAVPPLPSLGFGSDDIRRLDLKLGYKRIINGHDFLVFANISAPANDEWSTLEIEWEIQDKLPGDLRRRDYGPVLTDFFRNVVLRTFYTKWFLDSEIRCVSER